MGAQWPNLDAPTGGRVQFEEIEPWELGFADYFDDWVAPELSRIEQLTSAAQRRYRWRVRLLLGGGILLVLLVAEASASVPITLLWAALLAIVGGGLAHTPVAASREQALAALRDRVIGFYGLRPMRVQTRLQAELLASGLAKPGVRLAWGEQFWGLYEGTEVRWARLSGGPVGRGGCDAREPDGRAPATDPGSQPGPTAWVLLLHAGAGSPVAATGQVGGRGNGSEALGHQGPDACPDGDCPPAEPGAALDLLADAFGGTGFELARHGDRVLILARGDLPGFDWVPLTEASGPLDAASIEGPARALLRSLYRLLSAARILAGAGTRGRDSNGTQGAQRGPDPSAGRPCEPS